MAHYVGDRIKELASSAGLLDFVLLGAVADFLPFSSKLAANGDTTWYCADNGSEWEIAVGTRTSVSGLARPAVPLSSSNGGAKVNFSAPPTVFCVIPASQLNTVGTPAFRAYATANQNGIVSNTGTRVAFGGKTFDTNNAFDVTTGVFTAPMPGMYRFEYSFFGRGTTLTTVIGSIRKNGIEQSYSDQATAVSNAERVSGGDTFMLAAGDTVDVVGYLTGTGCYVDGSTAAQSTFSGSLIAGTAMTVTTSPAPEPWHYIGDAGEPAFQNAFANYDANHRAAYYKDVAGRVHVKGLVKGGSTGAIALTLPVGYRPEQEIRFPTTVNAAFGSLVVATNGSVTFEAGNPATTWGSLDVINFRAA